MCWLDAAANNIDLLQHRRGENDWTGWIYSVLFQPLKAPSQRTNYQLISSSDHLPRRTSVCPLGGAGVDGHVTQLFLSSKLNAWTTRWKQLRLRTPVSAEPLTLTGSQSHISFEFGCIHTGDTAPPSLTEATELESHTEHSAHIRSEPGEGKKKDQQLQRQTHSFWVSRAFKRLRGCRCRTIYWSHDWLQNIPEMEKYFTRKRFHK